MAIRHHRRRAVALTGRLLQAAPVAAGLALAATVFTGGQASAAPTALPAACTQSGQTVTCSYAFAGSEQAFTVPGGISMVQVTAIGAAGGGDGYGGEGGLASAALTVTPGATLYAEVGGVGGGFTGVNSLGGPGGFNGGGNGAASDTGSNGRPGGGGASDVRTTSIATIPDSALTTADDSRLVVAGGGGGEYGDIIAPGGAAGQPGTPCCAESAGGGAGTLTAGGAGAPPATAGVLGQGGAGGLDQPLGSNTSERGGGAGGGGYYGGGGGNNGGGGGGGSSFVPAGGTTGLSSAASSVTISYTQPVTATTTAVTSSANPTTTGQAVTYTATVSPTDGGGTVAFNDGGSPITGCTAQPLNSSGQATCQATYTAAGSHTITAVYSGDTAYAGSPSAALTQTVTQVVPDKADLKATLSVPAKAADGARVTETVTVTNKGPAAASKVVAALTPPGGLTVTNADGARVTGPVLTWSTPRLASGSSLTFTVTAQVGARAKGTVLVAAGALSATPDPDLLNNATLATIRLG
jgi:hypothetical protein